jgi:L-glyceraldehyde 3-phosphate reductase
MSYAPDVQRYDGIPFRRSGQSGVTLRPISAVLWQNFGDAILSAFERLD